VIIGDGEVAFIATEVELRVGFAESPLETTIAADALCTDPTMVARRTKHAFEAYLAVGAFILL